MNERRKEMLVDVLGAIGWQGFDLAVYKDGSWGYESKNRYESNPSAIYIDLEDRDYWVNYLEDYETPDVQDGIETYGEVYEKVDDENKKAMLDAVYQAIGDNIEGQEEHAPYEEEEGDEYE